MQNAHSTNIYPSTETYPLSSSGKHSNSFIIAWRSIAKQVEAGNATEKK